MKVLEDAGPWSVQVRCTGNGNGGKGCTSLLEAEAGDLRFFTGNGSDSWGATEDAVVVKCPVCGVCTDLKKTDWPNSAIKLTAWTKAWSEPQTGVSNDVK